MSIGLKRQKKEDNDDVDNPSDDIAKTFFKIDDDDVQTLDKLFNF